MWRSVISRMQEIFGCRMPPVLAYGSLAGYIIIYHKDCPTTEWVD